VVQEGVVFAPQETRLPATQVEAVPLWGEQEENREGFEVAKRKAKAPREGAFSLRRIATQQSVWHPVLWQLGKREKDEDIRRLFGNEKGIEDQKDSHAGRLHFFPTFFTRKGLEIINPQDRKLRVGSNPIPFESVPRDSEGSFTVLYVPFDRIGEDEKETRRQVAAELRLVAEGLQAMFRIYGFGAKTSSGFGLAKEALQDVLFEIQAPGIQKIQERASSLGDLTGAMEKLAQQLEGGSKETQHE
jgi:hypothetical protein